MRGSSVAIGLVVAVVLAAGCGKKAENTSGGGAAAPEKKPAGPEIPVFAAQEVALDTLRLKAFVPQGWREEITTGSFARATYLAPDFNATLEIKETCGGICDPEKWVENVRGEAKQQLEFFNDPTAYQPAADVEVKQDGETAPGHYALVVRTTPKDPAAGGFVQVRATVWRYGPEWEQVVVCRFEGREEHEAFLEAAVKACDDLERLGPAAPGDASTDASGPPL